MRGADMAERTVRDTKTCAKCKVEQVATEFAILKATGRRYSYCRTCNNAAMAKWRAANPERSRNSARNRRLVTRFGITLAQYHELLASQDGRCAICRTAATGTSNELFDVDHDHATGVVRGLLCRYCNLGVGQLGDDPARLQAAADYLERQR